MEEFYKKLEKEYGIDKESFKKLAETVMFRLMPHSTRACDDVPEWLKELMPCPERPDGARVKTSPTDPRYLKLFGKAG